MAHSPETKAMAVGMILTGYRVNEIARTLNVPRQTISDWNIRLEEILDECFREDGRYPSLSKIGQRMRISRTKLD